VCLSVLPFTFLEALESLLPLETLDGSLRHQKQRVLCKYNSHEQHCYEKIEKHCIYNCKLKLITLIFTPQSEQNQSAIDMNKEYG